MVRLVATKPHRYNTRQLQAGDEFDAIPRDAKILQHMRRAKPVTVKPTPKAEGGEFHKSDLYQMRRTALTEFLVKHGDDADHIHMTRQQLLDRALGLWDPST